MIGKHDEYKVIILNKADRMCMICLWLCIWLVRISSGIGRVMLIVNYDDKV